MGNRAFRFVSAGDMAKMLATPGNGDSVDTNVYPYGSSGAGAGMDYNGLPYDPSVTFSGGGPGSQVVNVSPSTGIAVGADGQQVGGWVNTNVTNQLPFSAIPGVAAVQILQKNLRRNMIIIQNQSSVSNLWYCFGRPAIPNLCPYLVSGQTIGLDYTCPPDALYVYFDGSATVPQPGILIEITRQF